MSASPVGSVPPKPVNAVVQKVQNGEELAVAPPMAETKQSSDQRSITHSLILWWAASGFVGSAWLWPGDQAQARAVVEGIWLGL